MSAWRGRSADRSVPPGLSEFDTDGDGQWSADELAALRETAREQIRSGAPLGPRQ